MKYVFNYFLFFLYLCNITLIFGYFVSFGLKICWLCLRTVTSDCKIWYTIMQRCGAQVPRLWYVPRYLEPTGGSVRYTCEWERYHGTLKRIVSAERWETKQLIILSNNSMEQGEKEEGASGENYFFSSLPSPNNNKKNYLLYYTYFRPVVECSNEKS